MSILLLFLFVNPTYAGDGLMVTVSDNEVKASVQCGASLLGIRCRNMTRAVGQLEVETSMASATETSSQQGRPVRVSQSGKTTTLSTGGLSSYDSNGYYSTGGVGQSYGYGQPLQNYGVPTYGSYVTPGQQVYSAGGGVPVIQGSVDVDVLNAQSLQRQVSGVQAAANANAAAVDYIISDGR